jgi:hypothetical protein
MSNARLAGLVPALANEAIVVSDSARAQGGQDLVLFDH